MKQTAKIVLDECNQAALLPNASRGGTDNAFARWDSETGAVELSPRPTARDGFFEVLARADVPDEFLDPEDRAQDTEDRDPFADWSE